MLLTLRLNDGTELSGTAVGVDFRVVSKASELP